MNDYSPAIGDQPAGEYHIVADAFGFTRAQYIYCPFILFGILLTVGVLVGGVAHDYVFTSK